MPAEGIFDVLLEADTRTPRCRVEEDYGAALTIPEGRVAVNFVSTLDGVVSFGRAADDSRSVGGGILADRLLMAMLRALAGTIVVGAGTLRATLNHQWTPGALVPERSDDLVALRKAAGLPPGAAPLLVVTGGGALPRDAVALAHPAVPVHVLDAAGVAPLSEALAAGPGHRGHLSAAAIVEAASTLASGGPVLCEGGPHLFGSLLEDGVPIELFLTVAPQLAGRSPATPQRRSLVEGAAFSPFARPATLVSSRRAGDHLLLRYALPAPLVGV